MLFDEDVLDIVYAEWQSNKLSVTHTFCPRSLQS
jgi:hypothetical protein